MGVLRLAAFATAVALISTPVSAGTFIMHAAGTFDGYDYGELVFDLPFEVDLTFTFDDADVIDDKIANQSYARAGADVGPPSDVYGVLVANGISYAFSGAHDTTAMQTPETFHFTVFSPTASFIIGTYVPSSDLPVDILAAPTGDLCAFAVCFGHSFSAGDRWAGGLTGLNVLTVSYTPGDGRPTPAPEPTAWALMILGLGATGAMLRRRLPTLTSHAV